jgi:hypothetical protein
MRVCAQYAHNMSVCGYVEESVNARAYEPLSVHWVGCKRSLNYREAGRGSEIMRREI